MRPTSPPCRIAAGATSRRSCARSPPASRGRAVPRSTRSPSSPTATPDAPSARAWTGPFDSGASGPVTAVLVPSDIAIAQAAKLRPVADIAAELGLDAEEIELYGKYKAKVRLPA